MAAREQTAAAMLAFEWNCATKGGLKKLSREKRKDWKTSHETSLMVVPNIPQKVLDYHRIFRNARAAGRIYLRPIATKSFLHAL
jgi:hypothetical protein